MIGGEITVFKRNLAGEVTWQYHGTILHSEANAVVLEAFFNRPDQLFQNISLKENDRFLETFYTDRWYSIYEIHDCDDGKIKGWYANISTPAEIGADSISYVDLALDLWVSPNGSQIVLDEDEFSGLPLDGEMREKALTALIELKMAFKTERPPG